MLPERTVERLSEYRRTLLSCLGEGKTYIYSHELAKLHDITAVQVRRDIMLMGFTGALKKGYFIKDLVDAIGQLLDFDPGINVAIIGLGHLGSAVTAYYVGKRSKLNIVAAFDVDQTKIDKEVAGIRCYHISKLNEVVKEKDITIAIITVPSPFAVETSEALVGAGIKGILNFTSVPLKVPENIFLENRDMISSLEKIAYFVKNRIS